jgi:serine/threonine protein kinase
MLFDEQATRSGILSALGQFAYQQEGDGTLLFYFAGHGQVLGDQAHLVTIDAQPHDPGISLAHLGQLMESAGAAYRHVVVLLDSCHSGAAYNWTSSRPLRAGDVHRNLRSVNESRCILAACRPEQVAQEFDGQGLFTSKLVSGLLGGAVNGNGDVTVLGLYDYVSGIFGSEDQMPVFKGDIAGTVILGSGFEPAPGASVDDDEAIQIVSRGRHMLDDYEYLQQRELSNPTHRDLSGLAACAAELETLVRWFDTSEKGRGVLATSSEWAQMRDIIRNYVGNVTPISAGQRTRAGIVRDKLGTGGFGNVWRVEDGSNTVAYKIYHPSELHDEVKVERFKNGYSNMRKLEHPRIVRVRDLTLAPLGIVMDYIEGANLRDSYLDRSDEAQCLKLMKEIAETVEHAHGRGVKHRDIKPENIIIQYGELGDPEPFLTDFDLAYHQTNRTMTAMYGVGGVLNYAAPEQLHTPTAAAARSPAVDVFSLAQLMFFVVTAEDPASDAPEQNRTRLARATNAWADPRAVRVLNELYDSSTQRDPAMRPESVAEVLKQLAKAETYVLAESGDDRIGEERFIDRIAHSYRGYGNYSSSGRVTSMLSLSGQVAISLQSKGRSTNRTDHIDVEMELSVTGAVPVSSFTTGVNARRLLNQKLDRIVRRFERVERHAGNSGAFQTFIVVRNVALSTEGVVRVVEVLSECVSCVDGA